MKRAVGFHAVRGADQMMSPAEVRGNFYRPGWVLGVFYDESQGKRRCLLNSFVDRFLKALNSSHSEVPVQAFHDSYEVLTEDGRHVSNFTCFLVSGDGIWLAAADEAKILLVRADECENMVKARSPAQQVLESGFSRPKIHWEIIEDDDLFLVSGNSNLFSVLTRSKIAGIVRECRDPERSAEALVEAAQKTDPLRNFAAVVIPLK